MLYKVVPQGSTVLRSDQVSDTTLYLSSSYHSPSFTTLTSRLVGQVGFEPTTKECFAYIYSFRSRKLYPLSYYPISAIISNTYYCSTLYLKYCRVPFTAFSILGCVSWIHGVSHLMEILMSCKTYRTSLDLWSDRLDSNQYVYQDLKRN